MVDVPVGAAFGALRLGIQIVSTAQRPLIEIYQRMHNVLGPEQEIGYANSPQGKEKTRFADHYLSFTAVNIGTRRAENVEFRVGDDGLKREHPFSYGELFQTTIPYLAPGQALTLLRLEETELLEYTYTDEPNGLRVGTPGDFKSQRLKLNVAYDGPEEGLGWVTRKWARWRKKPQYRFKYEFDPRSVATAYPPVEVLG